MRHLAAESDRHRNHGERALRHLAVSGFRVGSWERSPYIRGCERASVTLKVVQGLRGLAALLVISVHLGNSSGFAARYLGMNVPFLGSLARFGDAGVDLFFVISGFIMVVSTLRPDGRSLSPVEFLKRRFIRIYPPVWIIDALVLIVYLRFPALVNSHGGDRPDVVASFLLLPQTGAALVLVTWTLVFEMYFYAVFAVALVRKAKYFVEILAAWGVAIVVMSLALSPAGGPYAEYLSRPISFEFLIGAAIGGLAMVRVPFSAALASLACGGVALAACAVGILSGALAFPDGWARVAFSIPIAMTVYGLIAIERERGTFVPNVVEKIGDASYAMYLLHVPLLTLLGIGLRRLHPTGRPIEIALVLFAYLSVILVGYAFFWYVERPLTAFLRHGARGRGARLAA